MSAPIRRITVFLALLLLLAPLVTTQATPASDPLLDRQPITFVANRGQWTERVAFKAQHGPMTAWFHPGGWTVDYVASSEPVGSVEPEGPGLCLGRHEVGPVRRKGVVVRMTFEGAQGIVPAGTDSIPGYFNYFLGDRPSRWATRVPAFQRLHYPAMYPGVDVRVREQDGQIEYDLCLAPGARLAQVVVRCDGIDGLALDEDGALVMKTRFATLRQAAPKTWYELPSGNRVPVRCTYRILGPRRYAFEVRDRRSDALVIDPGLEWSTYLGGSATDVSRDVVVDALGISTVVTETPSVNFPTTSGAYDTTHNGMTDIAVSQFDPRKTGVGQLRWSTFIGGSGDVYCRSINLDAAGSFTLTCSTTSTNFPITAANAYLAKAPGGWSGAVIRLGTAGDRLLYSTYFGGYTNDWMYHHRPGVDKNGVITFTGGTYSSNLPTTSNAYSRTFSGGSDVFVARLDPSLKPANQLLYSTFIGGSLKDHARQVVVDAAGVLTVGGYTFSSNFPTTPNAFPFRGGAPGLVVDAFVLQLDPARVGSKQLIWSTFFGGSGPGTQGSPGGDGVNGVALTRSGLIVIGGWTDSLDLPVTSNAFDKTYNGGGSKTGGADVMLAHLDPDPSKAPNQSVVYCTYLGGSGGTGDAAWSVTVDSADTATLAGWADSNNDFPTTAGAFQTQVKLGVWAGFVTRLHRAPTLLYSTYLGGVTTLGTDCYGHALDSTGGVTVVGSTDEPSFPMKNPFQSTYGGGAADGIVTRLDMLPTGVARYGAATASCQGSPFILVDRMPVSPSPKFAFIGTDAPPTTSGYLVIGFAPIPGGLWIPGLNFTLLVPPPAALLPVSTDAVGHVVTPLAIPSGIKGVKVYCQYLFNNTGKCGPLGTVSASPALEVAFQ